MARNVLVAGRYPWWNLALYSKYLITRNTSPHRIVIPRNSRNREKLRFTSDAQASTMVTLELISTTVLRVASGTFR